MIRQYFLKLPMADKPNNCLERIKATEKCLCNKTFSLDVISNRHRNEISSHCCNYSPSVSPLSKRRLLCVEFQKKILLVKFEFIIYFFGFAVLRWCLFAGLSKWSEYWARFVAASIYSHSTVIHHIWPYMKNVHTWENRQPDISYVCNITQTPRSLYWQPWSSL